MGSLAWNRKRRADFEPLAVGWCSGSDAPLPGQPDRTYRPHPDGRRAEAGNSNHLDVYLLKASLEYLLEIGRASCRERVCQYVYISVVAVSLKKKYTSNT